MERDEECLDQAVSDVLHVVVVGFHHTKGPVIEFVYPRYPGGADTEEGFYLPPCWQNLSFFAIPDRAHMSREIAFGFHLSVPPEYQKSHPDANTVFGISCCRQADSRDVGADKEITRNSVMKAVVVLSVRPLYLALKDTIGSVTRRWFQKGVLSDFVPMVTLLNGLERMVLHKDVLCYTTYFNEMLNRFGVSVLKMAKLFLLEKKIVVYSDDIEMVSDLFYSIIHIIPDLDGKIGKAQGVGHRRNVCRFPRPFSSPRQVVQPHFPLNELQKLMDQRNNDGFSYIIGTTNKMLASHMQLSPDIIINMNEGKLFMKDSDENDILSSSDVRFAEYLMNSRKTANECYIANEMRNYFLSLIYTFEYYLYCERAPDACVRSPRSKLGKTKKSSTVYNMELFMYDYSIYWFKEWSSSSGFINWSIDVADSDFERERRGIAVPPPYHPGRLLKMETSIFPNGMRFFGKSDSSSSAVNNINKLVSTTTKLTSILKEKISSKWNGK